MASRSYHHGDLRRALLDKAFELFELRGNLDFSLRELARHAGVTHNAPYRHFASKADLLDAMTEEGLTRLAKEERLALERAGDDKRKRVHALGESYIRFAVNEPTVFRLALHSTVDPKGEAHKLAVESYFILERSLAEAQKAGVARQDMPARDLTLAAWAFVHGIASLLVSGRLPNKEAAVSHYVHIIGTLFFEGVGAAKV